MDRTPTNSITEAAFAAQIGLSRPSLKKLRDRWLVQGVDWLPDSGGIQIAISGQKKIRAALDLPPEPIAPSLVTLALAWPPLRVAAVNVVRVISGNEKILFCAIGGLPVRVRVRSNKLFVPGMVLEGCTHVQADYYEYTGRMPRRKGRWN